MGGPETSGTVLLIEQTQQVGTEEDFPNVSALGSQADDFPTEGTTHESLTSLPIETAIGTDASLGPRCRIIPNRQRFW